MRKFAFIAEQKARTFLTLLFLDPALDLADLLWVEGVGGTFSIVFNGARRCLLVEALLSFEFIFAPLFNLSEIIIQNFYYDSYSI